MVLGFLVFFLPVSPNLDSRGPQILESYVVDGNRNKFKRNPLSGQKTENRGPWGTDTMEGAPTFLFPFLLSRSHSQGKSQSQSSILVYQ